MSSQNLRLNVMFAASDRLSGSLKKIIGLGQTGSEKLAAMKREARDVGRGRVQVGICRAHETRTRGSMRP